MSVVSIRMHLHECKYVRICSYFALHSFNDRGVAIKLLVNYAIISKVKYYCKTKEQTSSSFLNDLECNKNKTFFMLYKRKKKKKKDLENNTTIKKLAPR